MDDIDKNELGKRIKDIRVKLGLSMEDFGALLETSKGAVNNWEKGKNAPNNKRLKKIAELGKVSIDELMYGSLNSVIYNMMKEFEDFPYVFEMRKDEFSARGTTPEESAYLKNIFDYANYRVHASAGLTFPKEKLDSSGNFTDEYAEELEEFHKKSNTIKDKKIFFDVFSTAKQQHISPKNKLHLSHLLARSAENLFNEYTKDSKGLVFMTSGKLNELIEEINDFIYIYDSKKDEYNWNENIDKNLANKVIAIIESCSNDINELEY